MKKVRIIIWVLIVSTVIVNIIALSNRIVFIDNEKSEILKERFELPKDSRVLVAIIPKSFFRPYFKIVYFDNIICIKDTGKIGEAGDTAFSILTEMMESDIFKYIGIFNMVNIVIVIILFTLYKFNTE